MGVLKNLSVGCAKSSKLKKVTTSQDDGLVGVLKNLSVGCAKSSKIKKVTTLGVRGPKIICFDCFSYPCPGNLGELPLFQGDSASLGLSALRCRERRSPVHPAILSRTTREDRFSPSLVRAVANAAMGREDVLPFWFGESDQPTPSFIREAAIQSLRAGETFYAENLGRPFLREALSTYLTDLHRCSIPTERIAVTASGNSALMLASQLLLTPGDRVVTVTPLWPNAVEIPKIMGGQVTCVSLEVRDGQWALPLEKLLQALTPDTRMLVLNSPNNPTGWTIQRAEQRAILEHCRRHGIWILADDVYERLIFSDGMRSAPSFLTMADERDRLIVVNSFSKAWTMTGWRVGWMVAPPDGLA